MPLSAAALPISPGDLARLRRWSSATRAPAVVVQRAKILLLAAEGVANTEIAERLGASRPTVNAPQPATEGAGVTHWSSRRLAAEVGVSHSTVARVWVEHDLKPWQTGTFRFSTDPEPEAKVRDVVGLYLDPPAHAIVLCVCG